MAGQTVECVACGHVGEPQIKGSIWITIILLFVFFPAAIIYEIWRRIGLGVCSNCGSDAVTPSNQCTTHKPSDVGDLVVLFVVGVIGAILLVGIYALIQGGPDNFKTTQNYENTCLAEGLKYYQNKGEYPMLADGKTLSMNKIQLDCKGSTTGKYVIK